MTVCALHGLLCTHTSVFTNDFINIVIWSLSAVAVVRLEKTFYPFSENAAVAFVCVEVFGFDIDCPIKVPITVNLTTSDGTAGKFT